MELDSALGQFGRPLQIFFVDLMLAGDNALLVAMVCSTLPLRYQSRALFLGTIGAVALRFVMSVAAMTVLALPAVRLVGAVLLMIIALNLVRPTAKAPEQVESAPAIAGVFAAGALIALVDVVMSVDNVVALAAVAQGSVLYLGLGLLLSVPFLFFGNALMVALLRRRPRLVLLGAGVLGWVAGGMLVSDPLVREWILGQAPALDLVVPALAAFYVVALGWMNAISAAAFRDHSSEQGPLRSVASGSERVV